MKVNFNKSFKDYKGEEIVKDGKKQMINDLLAQCLFTGEGIERTGNAEKDNKNKFDAYKLCQRLITVQGAIEISSEEAVIIKQVAANLNAGGYAQIVELIENHE